MRGEIILRKGDGARRAHQRAQDLGLIKTGIDYLALMGLVILAPSFYGYIFVYQNRPSIVESQGKIALLGIVILVVTLVGKILALIHHRWRILNPTAWADCSSRSWSILNWQPQLSPCCRWCWP